MNGFWIWASASSPSVKTNDQGLAKETIEELLKKLEESTYDDDGNIITDENDDPVLWDIIDVDGGFSGLTTNENYGDNFVMGHIFLF